MISIKHLVNNLDRYQQELRHRGQDEQIAIKAKDLYTERNDSLSELENLRAQQNDFNKQIVNLQGEEKQQAITNMKEVSSKIKDLEAKVKERESELDEVIAKIPNLSSSYTPVGESEDENRVEQVWGEAPQFEFEPKAYWQLPVYEKYVSQEDGVKAMGSRGYYLKGEVARLQKVLFDYVLDLVLQRGFEMMYVPLMLNEQVLRGTGHIPDFDGQQYEIKIDENKSFYLIGSSEPSIMGYYMKKNVGELDEPILNTCWSSCFRKEAGSYGKDQQGILRVHQFEKVEMTALCDPKDTERLFELFNEIEEEIYTQLNLYFRKVELCTGDLPSKHRRQVDYEVYFPSQEKFRENCSNGDAGDYQNRGLGIKYVNAKGEKDYPDSLNCTAVTFRTGLAIMEQNQMPDGRVKIPEVLQARFGKEFLE